MPVVRRGGIEGENNIEKFKEGGTGDREIIQIEE